jgi:hypothetical protein
MVTGEDDAATGRPVVGSIVTAEEAVEDAAELVVDPETAALGSVMPVVEVLVEETMGGWLATAGGCWLELENDDVKPLLAEGGTTEDEVDPVLNVGGTTDPDDKDASTGRPVAGLNAWPVVGSIGKPLKGSIWSPVFGSIARPGNPPVEDPEEEIGGTNPADDAAELTGRPVAGSNVCPVAELIGSPVKGSTPPFELPKEDPPTDPPAGKAETEAMGTSMGGLFPALLFKLPASTGGLKELEDNPGVNVGDAMVVMLAEKLAVTTEGMTTAVAELPELEFAFPAKASSSSGESKVVTLLMSRWTFSSTVVAGSRFT